jgi:hypothetical protein
LWLSYGIHHMVWKSHQISQPQLRLILPQLFGVWSMDLTRSQVPCWTQLGSKSVKQWNCLELRARSLFSTLKDVEGHAEALRWD